jgi:hypothetical protein
MDPDQNPGCPNYKELPFLSGSQRLLHFGMFHELLKREKIVVNFFNFSLVKPCVRSGNRNLYSDPAESFDPEFGFLF